ncbi:MAG: hypothetical protein M5U34_48920 [Chloroflexi bacterium]|nr:hypothetical protein [Chloroflexota bacterium]
MLSDKTRRAIYDSLLNETKPAALTLTVQNSSAKVKISDSAQILYFLVEVSPPTHVTRSRRPLNLCLVLDRSTSMQESA